MQKITRNTFEKGLNSDIDPAKLDPQTYVDAQNIELHSDDVKVPLGYRGGWVGSPTVVRGVTKIDTFFAATVNTTGVDYLGAVSCDFKITTYQGYSYYKPAIVTFLNVAGETNPFRIYIKLEGENILNQPVFLFYSGPEQAQGNSETGLGLLDLKVFSENGTNYIYFTDGLHEVRKLRCHLIYNGPGSVVLPTAVDLSLQRRGANGKITLTSITADGSLLSGSYQFAYRMLNPETNVYTKWSSLTNPIHVYKQDASSSGFYTSGYGVFTNRTINLTIAPSPDEAQFHYYQLAVVENIFPDGNTGALNASLLATEEITIGSTANYAYSSNIKIDTIPIEELVVDYAAIKTAKTLNITRNRLFVGNVEYNDLRLTVIPTVTTGSILKDTSLTTAAISLDTVASSKKGYFRDEVYRFGIVYFDKYGNKSAPYTLRMNDVLGNTILGATDMKFPKRTQLGYSILNNSNYPQSLGLSLTIENHPTWAVGFEIVRQKRIKRVLFQSPVVPMMSVKGVGAFENYPATGVIKTGSTVGTTSYTGAQPQTSDSVLAPKNLFFPELRDISKNSAATSGTGTGTKQTGESYYTRRDNYSTVMLFPQENVYENKDYSFLGSEQLDIVDFVATKANVINYEPSITTNLGNDIDTNIAANFYAIEDDFYYCDNSTARTISENYNIADTLYLDNYSSGSSFGGSKVLTYSDLQTEGVPLGTKPNAQRALICKLSKSIPDECSTARTFAGGTYRAFPNAGSYIFGSSGATYDDTTSYINNYTVSQSAWLSTVPIQQFRIANVINPNIGDNRYGDKDSQNEFISTGTKYAFTSGEITSVQAEDPTPITVNVWGGDCFVTSHVFKVADSAYSVVNQEKYTTGASSESSLVDKWGTVFRITGASGGTANLAMPVAVKGAAQYVQLFLESEYNGQAMEQDLLVPASAVSGLTANNRGSAANGTSGSSWSFQPSSNCTAGALVMIAIAYDPGGVVGSDVGITSIYDSHGNPYTNVLTTTTGLGAGVGNGICYRIYKTYQPNGRLLTSSTIYVTFGGPVVEKTVTITEFYSTNGNYVSIFSSGTNSTGSPGGTSPSISTFISANQAILGITAAENGIGSDSDTTFGTWSTAQNPSMSNPGSIRLSSQYKIVNTDGSQTYNTTLSGSANYIIGYVYITEASSSTFLLSPATNANGGAIAVKSCLTYNINKNLIRNNDEKSYFALPDFLNINYNFNSRIHYSDLKVYNSDVQGFDIFRVSNFYDLEESGGPLTKLAVAGDNFYSIQEKRISYLPASDRLLETADAGLIAVGSSNVISIARVIDLNRGCYNIQSVVESGDGIFMFDMRLRSIYFLQGQQLDIISDRGLSNRLKHTFDNEYNASPQWRIKPRGVYDPVKKQYYFIAATSGYQNFDITVNVDRTFCYCYDLPSQRWISNYNFNSNYSKLAAIINVKSEYRSIDQTHINQTNYLYAIALENPGGFGAQFRNLSVYKLFSEFSPNAFYTSNSYNAYSYFESYIQFYVNPDESFTKIFDNVIVETNIPPLHIYISLDNNALNEYLTIPLNSNETDGTYRYKIPRYNYNKLISNDPVYGPEYRTIQARFRGLKIRIRYVFNTTVYGNFIFNGRSTLTSFWTKYRLASRRPF